ncbi:MAG TPA: TonB-dependent receptor [Candidatus Eisenbacteria bacterium]
MNSRLDSCRALRRALAVVLLLLLSVPRPAHAAAHEKPATANVLDMSLDQLMLVDLDSVYGASGFKQRISEAPASVIIVTAEDIKALGYRTLADILRDVRSCYVSYDRNYSYLGFRGYGPPGDYNSRIALMVDGHRINDNIFDGSLLGTEFPIDVDLIDRVEVIRGPNSSLYVASAFLGVVNVITKRGRDVNNLNVAGGGASYGTWKGRLSYGNSFANGLEMLLSASSYESHGQDQLFFPEFAAPGTHNGIAVAADGDRSRQVFANASWGGFTSHGVLGSREKGIPTAPFGTVFNDAGTRTVDTRGYLDLQYRRELARGWSLADRAYYDHFANDGRYVYDYSTLGGPSRVLNKNFAHGKWFGDELNFSKQLFEGHRVSVGAEYRDNFEQNQGNYDVEPFFQYLSDRRSSTSFSVYGQDEVRLLENLILNLGLRYDRYSTFGGTTNPRAALIYRPRDNTTFKVLYGQSFRAPNLFELFYTAPGNEVNPGLRPETARTTELVWEQSLAHHLGMTASTYFYPIRGLIGEEVDPANGNFRFTNAGSLDLRGMDFGFWRKLPGGFESSLSYSFQDVKNVNSVVPIINSPRHLLQATVEVPLIGRRLYASSDAQFVSRRATLAGGTSGAYAVSNLALVTRDLARDWEFSASLYNVFDRRFTDPRSNGLAEDVLVQDGRTFRLTARYRFGAW